MRGTGKVRGVARQIAMSGGSMNKWNSAGRVFGWARAAALFAALVPALASAQLVVSEDFTCQPSQGNTSTSCPLANSWTAINGACLTAGAGSNGSIPSCVGLPYYVNKGDRYQVGGYSGYLGNSSPPSSNQTQAPDPQGHGALRLTNGYPFFQENGAIVSTVPFNAGEGVQVTFKTVSYRGDSGGGGGDGADGMSFFLLDASQYQSGSGLLGSWGGSLGYSCSNSNPPYTGQIGYMGLGLDEYGNFLNNGDNTATGVPATAGGWGDYQWNRIGLRGAGNVSWAWLTAHYGTLYPSGLSSSEQQSAVRATCSSGYLWDYSNPGNPVETTTTVQDYAPIPGANTVLSGVTIANESAVTRADATPIDYVLKITPDGLLSLSYAINGGALTEVLANQSITSNNGSLPSSLLFGFAGSTGGSDNVHEILCFTAGPAQQSAASATVNLPQNELTTNSQVYIPSYHTANWWGELTANNLIVSNGTVSAGTVNWDASCVLTGGTCASMSGAPSVSVEGPSSRTILSWNGAAGVPFEWGSLSTAEKTALNPSAVSSSTSPRLDYLRGDRSNEVPTSGPTGTQIYRDRTSVLGDIIDSSPDWVGPPSGSPSGVGGYASTWSDKLYPSAVSAENVASSTNNYSAFYRQYAGRENVVYEGANDGLLHGFRSGSLDSSGNLTTAVYPNDGHEVLAYMPGAVVQQIHSTASAYDYSNTGYSHIFGVDASPRAGDLFYGGAWHTWLVGGLGAGGSAIYALDVTDPTQFSESNAASLVQGEWTPSTIHCGASSGSPAWNCGQHLGNTYGKPVVWRFHAENSTGNNMWGAVFGSGFPNRITGSIAPSGGITGSIGNIITGSIGVSFTGSIASNSNVLNVTAVSSGVLAVGQTISGRGINPNTTIQSLGTGGGGIGTYYLSNQYSTRIRSEGMAASSTTLTVTAGSGIAVGQTVSGSTVVPGTTITGLGTGGGGPGTYTVSSAQAVPSTSMVVPGTTLTVSAGGGLAVGQTITGAGVASATTITALGTGTGGPGTYTVSQAQSVSSEALSNGIATLTVTQGSGIAIGQTVFGSGVAAGTTVVAQTSGATGGVGTYTVSGASSVPTASETLYTGASSTGTAGIYVMLVDPATGAKSFTYLDTGVGPSQDPLGQGRPDGIAYVTPVDLDGDNTVDYAYAGDLFGNVWRFDLTSNSASSWHVSTFGNTAATPLFKTPTQTLNGVLVGQPITSMIAATLLPLPTGKSGVFLMFGTGQEVPFTPTSQASYAAGPQSLYGVWDWNMSAWNSMSAMNLAAVSESTYGSVVHGALTSADLATQVVTVYNGGNQTGGVETITNNPVCWYGSNNCSSANDQFGWQVGLPNTDEQVIYSPTFSFGILLVNTTIPSPSTPLDCTFVYPTGYTMALNPQDGGAFASTSNGSTTQVSAFLDRSSGMPMTWNSLAVSGLQTGGVGSVFTFRAGGGGATGPAFFGTATSNGGVTGQGLNTALNGVSGHRVTWTQLR